MNFILQQLGQLGMVVIIMVCAIGGTIWFLKVIKRFSPGNDFPKVRKKSNP